MDPPPPPEHVEAIARRLVGWPSETGTDGEAAFGPRLAALIREIPYFRDNPADVVLVPSHGDPLRHSVVALVRGTGRRTLGLAGHYDTVETRGYGDLQDRALDPDALVAAMTGAGEADAALRADLASGAFLPGRGMLDMKSGLAIAVALLERFALMPGRQGNLMLMASPDEERESRGARSLRDALPALAARLGIDMAGAINLDVTSDPGDGAEGRAIFAGTIGKSMPFALVVGRPAHAAYPFEGVSAAAVGAEILGAVEGDPDLSDRGDGFAAPPPICLQARDLREGYDVTTPGRFWLAFNWLHHAMTAAEILARFERVATAAAARAAVRQAAYAARHLGRHAGVAGTPPVLTVHALREAARRRGGAAAASRDTALEAEPERIDDPLEVSRRAACALWEASGLAGPAVVIGFAGLHYPPTALDRASGEGAILARALDAARAAWPGDAPTWRPVFQGISDMSFMGVASAPGGDLVAGNTPAARLIDSPAPDALAYPTVNVGPWGREFHQRGERVHRRYAFETLPRFLAAAIDGFLAAPLAPHPGGARNGPHSEEAP